MNRPLFAALASLLLAVPALAQATQPVTLPRSQQFDLTSKTGKTYRVFVAAPIEAPPAGGYGVLTVLDANPMFLTVAETARFQKGGYPTLVVGVGYPRDDGKLDLRRRYTDLTPVTPADKIVQSEREAKIIVEELGGEDDYLDFLTTELRDRLAQSYPIDANRHAIFGHSLGGRFVLHALLTRPGSFQTYLASSPSIWWGQKSILEEFAGFKPVGTPRVLITCGQLETLPPADSTAERLSFLKQVNMTPNAMEFAEKLKAAGVTPQFIEFPDENHGSVVPFAVSRGVRTALAK
jgi:uncharacterized protein